MRLSQVILSKDGRWVLKMNMDVHIMQRIALTFLEEYSKEGNGFLIYLIGVTGDESEFCF
jgi:hypothetical protein